MKKEGMIKKDKEGIFNALELAGYLNYLYKKTYKRNISPLKLQKSLFFLFGEWGAFISKASSNNAGDGKDLAKYKKYLFTENIEAWLYGPVVREVYDEFNNDIVEEEKILNTEEREYAGQFIRDLTSELFELSDFKLVELTHQMSCWQDNFEEKESFHCNIINKDDIINEFLIKI